jgi:hypothetical protein
MLFRLLPALLLLANIHLTRATESPPTADLFRWSIEQQPGGTVTVRDDALIIEDVAGCTVWFREKLTAPVEITYEVTPISRGGPHDRVSDMNCFWMAIDPRSPDMMPAGRSGKFEDYDSLRTYYVGMGGWNNTKTRFRRYAGDNSKPLLPEHDLSDPKFLLTPNKTHHIKLIAAEGVAEFWRDGEKIFSFRDPAPLTSGWFGLRTVKSHLEVRNLKITSLPRTPASPNEK